MTPKEEAKDLLKEFDFRGKPFNDAGIFVNEMIYEWKFQHRISKSRKYNIEYWQNVKKELEQIKAWKLFHEIIKEV